MSRWIHWVCGTFDYNYVDAGGLSQVRTAGANCLFSEDLSNSVWFFPNATLPPGVQALIAHFSSSRRHANQTAIWKPLEYFGSWCRGGELHLSHARLLN